MSGNETEGGQSVRASVGTRGSRRSSIKSDSILKEEFDFYIKQLKKKVAILQNYEEKKIACGWIKQLSASPLDQCILDYAKILHFALDCSKLVGPFSAYPPKDIVPLPPDTIAKIFEFNATEIAKAIASDTSLSNECNTTAACVPEYVSGYYEFKVKIPSSAKMVFLKEDDDVCTFKVAVKDDLNKCKEPTPVCQRENACLPNNVEQNQANRYLKLMTPTNDNECLRNIICTRIVEVLGSAGPLTEKKNCQPAPKSCHKQERKCCPKPIPSKCPREQNNIIDTMCTDECGKMFKDAHQSVQGRQHCFEDKTNDQLTLPDDCSSEELNHSEFTSNQYERMIGDERRDFWKPHNVDPRALGLRGIYDTPNEQGSPNSCNECCGNSSHKTSYGNNRNQCRSNRTSSPLPSRGYGPSISQTKGNQAKCPGNYSTQERNRCSIDTNQTHQARMRSLIDKTNCSYLGMDTSQNKRLSHSPEIQNYSPFPASQIPISRHQQTRNKFQQGYQRALYNSHSQEDDSCGCSGSNEAGFYNCPQGNGFIDNQNN